MQPISEIRVFTGSDTSQTRNDDLAVVVLQSGQWSPQITMPYILLSERCPVMISV